MSHPGAASPVPVLALNLTPAQSGLFANRRSRAGAFDDCGEISWSSPVVPIHFLSVIKKETASTLKVIAEYVLILYVTR